MISFIQGRIIDINKNTLLIENNGLGYEVNYLKKVNRDMPEIGDSITLYILPVIKDESFAFYGFSDLSDKHLVKKLIKIPGIGIKYAMNILSNIDHSSLFESIQNDNINTIQSIPGIGKKTAQRIISELKGEIPKIKRDFSISTAGDASLEQVSTALLNLGFKYDLIQEVLYALRKETKSGDMALLLKRALAIISEKRT